MCKLKMDKIKKAPIRSGGSLTWKERINMIEEYLSGGYTKAGIWYKYTGQLDEHGKMLQWMRKLGYIDDEPVQRTLPSRADLDYLQSVKSSSTNDPAELHKEIKKLKKQLEEARLKQEGYKLMIEIAEKEYKIPIRKKPNTK